MDLTTRLHNETTNDVTAELVDQFDLRRGPRRPIKAGGSIDLGRRIGFSDTNPQLRFRLRVAAETESVTIMPIHIFVNSEIYISSSIDPNTRKRMIRVDYRPASRSINRLRMIRWAKDLNAYVGATLVSSRFQPKSTIGANSEIAIVSSCLTTVGSSVQFK